MVLERTYLAFCISLLLCLASPFAHATIQPARNLDQMIVSAAEIVQGKIISKRAMWGPNKRYIYTEVTLQVDAYHQGTGQRLMKIHTIGGQVGKFASRVAGTAHLAIGEEVVLFLEPKRHKTFRFLLGMAAGKFNVIKQNNQVLLHRAVHGLSFYHQKVGQPHTIKEQVHSEPALQLSHLQTRIKALKQVPRHWTTLAPKVNTRRSKIIGLMRLHRLYQQQPALKRRPRFQVLPRRLKQVPSVMPKSLTRYPSPLVRPSRTLKQKAKR